MSDIKDAVEEGKAHVEQAAHDVAEEAKKADEAVKAAVADVVSPKSTASPAGSPPSRLAAVKSRVAKAIPYIVVAAVIVVIVYAYFS